MAQQIGLEAVLDLSRFSRGVKDYLSGLDKMNAKTGGFASAVGGRFQAVGKAALGATAVLAAAGIAAGAAVAKFAIDGIGKAKDLQAQMSGIAAVMNKTSGEVGPLKDLILKLGLNPNLTVSVNEAADAIEMLARNGLSMTEILNGAAHSTVLLANATGADFGTAADIATDAMAIFKIDAENMTEAVNGIASVVVNSKFDINDYALALSQGGGVAAAAGVEFNDFNTAIAAISPLFASGSDAGTSFKTMIMSMNPKTDEAAQLMKQLGIDFYDANGQMKDMADIAAELNDAFFQEVTFSTSVSNATAEQTSQRALLEEQIRRTNTELYKYQVGINGVAQSEADKIVSIDRLNRQHDAAVAAYSQLAGTMGTTITTTRELTEAEKNAALTTIFGTDASRAAIALAESGSVVYEDLATAVNETGISQDILNKYMEDGNLTAIELLQAQQELTDAEKMAATQNDNLKGAMAALGDAIDTVQLKIGDLFLPLLEDLARWAADFVSQHATAVVAAFEGFASAISQLSEYTEAFLATGERMPAFFADLTPDVAALVLAFWNTVDVIGAVTGAIATVVEPIATAIGSFVEWKDVLIVLGAAIAVVVLPVIGSMMAAVAATAAVFAAAVLAVAAVRKAWETDFLGIKTATLGAFDAIKTALTPLTSAIQQFGSGALTEIRNWASGNETEFTNVKAIWEGAKQAASNLFTGITSYASSHLPTWKAKLTEWATEGAAWVQTATTAALGYLAQWVAAITDYVSAQLPAWKAELTEWATAAWQWIVDASALVAAKLAQWFADLKAALDAKLPTWKAEFLKWASATYEWIAPAAIQGGIEVGKWAGALIGFLAKNLPKWIAGLLEWAAALISWVTSKQADAIPNLGTWLGKVLGWMTLAAVKMAIEAVKWAGALIGWIVTDLIPEIGPNLGLFLVEFLKGLGRIFVSIVEFTKNVAVEWWRTVIGAIKEELGIASPSKVFAEIGVNLVEGIIDGLKSMASALLAAWQTFVDWVDLGATIVRKIKLGIITIRDDITTVISNLATSLYSLVLETDWLELGKSLLTLIKDGVSSAASKLYDQMRKIAGDAAQKFIDFDWSKLGKEIINGILKGLKDNADKVIDWMKGLAGDLVKKVTDALLIGSPSKVFAEIGRNIIEGWILGMQQAESGLLAATGSLVDKVLGRIVRGQEDAVQSLSSTLGSLTGLGKSYLDSTLADLERLQQMTADAGPNANMSNWGTIFNRMATQEGVIGEYTDEQKRYDMLKQQADLVEFIRKNGGDVSTFLSGMTLGDNASLRSEDFLSAITKATKALNDNLSNTLRIAGQGWDKIIDNLSEGRQSIEEIEGAVNDRFAAQIVGLDAYRNEIIRIDDEIAQAESNLMNTGDQAWASQLYVLDVQRQGATQALQDYLTKINQIEQQLGSIPVTANSRAADAIAKFRSETLDPLIEDLGDATSSQYSRSLISDQINGNIDVLRDYVAGIANVEAMQTRFDSLFGGTAFGETIQANVESIFDSLYDVSSSSALRQQGLRELEAYATQISSVLSQTGRISGDTPGMERYQTEVLDPLLNRMLDINTTTAQRTQLLFEYTAAMNKAVVVEQKQGKLEQIQSQLDLLQKAKDLSDQLGGRGAFDRIFAGLDPKMALTADQLATVMARYTDEAIRLANRQIIDIADLATVRDYSVELGRIVDRAISFESVLAEFDSESMTPLNQAQGYLEYYDREIVRLRTLAAEGNQASLTMAQNVMVQRDRIVQYMRTYLDKLYRADLQLDRLQESSNERAQEVADNYREAFIDPLREQIGTSFSTSFQDNAISLLGSRIDKINAYIASIKQMGDVEADISQARALNPLMGMLAAERIDPLIERLYDINTTEAQRLQITQQLVAEQQKLVALQEKQQKLDFLQQQLDLFNQIDQLNDQFDDIIPMSKILEGITFGLDASLDDMLELTSRSIDAIITAVKHQLGIASPSKVFAKIGQQTMQGLASGVKSAVSQPLSMMRQAASIMPYAMETRSLSINMGGVSINNGMDEVMFEARVRQIMEGAF